MVGAPNTLRSCPYLAAALDPTTTAFQPGCARRPLRSSNPSDPSFSVQNSALIPTTSPSTPGTTKSQTLCGPLRSFSSSRTATEYPLSVFYFIQFIPHLPTPTIVRSPWTPPTLLILIPPPSSLSSSLSSRSPVLLTRKRRISSPSSTASSSSSPPLLPVGHRRMCPSSHSPNPSTPPSTGSSSLPESTSPASSGTASTTSLAPTSFAPSYSALRHSAAP